LVGEARTLGLFGALELVPGKPARAFFPERGSVGTRCRDLSVKNGLVMRAVWDTMIAAPPLVITRAEIDELVSKAVQTLDQLHQDLRRDGLV
jgi:putrescine aminotransferase